MKNDIYKIPTNAILVHTFISSCSRESLELAPSPTALHSDVISLLISSNLKHLEMKEAAFHINIGLRFLCRQTVAGLIYNLSSQNEYKCETWGLFTNLFLN